MTTTELITTAMDIGDMLLENGAETYRVEESMYRICHAYGVKTAEIFAVPTTIIITVCRKDEAPITLTKRIYNRGTDLNKVDLLNTLCRDMCINKSPYDEVTARIAEIRNTEPYSLGIQILGFAFVAFFFTLLFEGNFKDALVALVTGAAIKVVFNQLDRIKTNPFFEMMVLGAITACFAQLSVHFQLADNMDKIIIGTIMSLVPGIAITNSMRDIIAGDLLAGVTKAVEALLIGTGIAVGAAIALTLLRPVLGV
ncbi:MAG: threonine/serine exporter family protein [Eubacterium sp.]|nr:threonine/serine exporter family protein [Eubacterium sp.]